jgi:hypothetical protein
LDCLRKSKSFYKAKLVFWMLFFNDSRSVKLKIRQNGSLSDFSPMNNASPFETSC